MTHNDLARAYPVKATKRRRVLEVLLEEQSYSDVVREAQELVELALKAMLRHVGIDPPKWPDVGSILKEQAPLFSETTRSRVDSLARISRRLRKEGELSFYGDIDFIPTEAYGREDAGQAIAEALEVLSAAHHELGGIE